MSEKFLRAALASGSAVAIALFISSAAQSQQNGREAAETLPEIVVQAPSPIQRPHRHNAQSDRATPSPAQAQAPAPNPDAYVGTLPVVTDQFATVTVVPNEEIGRSAAATLGDLLNNKPGITGSSFAPGASSRPIIRGLDVNRVGIVENGIGSNGASDLGEDHFVPIDPLSTNQVEVIRGPATLRYGSQSIGGVVSATNNRIPETLPCSAVPSIQTYGYNVKAPVLSPSNPCASFEMRNALSSVDLGREGAVLLDAAGSNVAIHADVFARKTEDYSTPRGIQRNSATQSEGGSVGGSYFFAGGFIGAAVQQNNSLYRIPGTEGEEFGTRIDAKQTKLTVKGDYHPDSKAIDVVRFWAGATDYKHNELGLEEGTGVDGIHQTFTNREQEGRVEVQFAPVNLRFASLTTAVGAQGSHQELSASSPDDPGSPLNGLWNPNNNTRFAGYIFNEFKFSDVTKAQIAGRVENVDLKGSMPTFIPNTFDIDVNPADIGPTASRNLNFTPKSGSVGLIQDLPWNLSASITGQYVERAPKPAELFSRGGHEATFTYDIGNPNLGIETAKSVEAGLRRATGPFRFELTGYYTRFNGFIYRRLTGNTCEGNACVDPADPAFPLELSQAIYSQRDATFRGGEFQFQYDVLPVWAGQFGVEGQYDIVRATFSDGTNVPRIPPQRVGGGIYYRDANWLARVNLLHAFAQNNVSGFETPTAGYNNLRAEVSYTARLAKDSWLGPREFTFGLLGNNLLNEDIRNAVAYNKDQVLQPGLGVRMFANVKY